MPASRRGGRPPELMLERRTRAGYDASARPAGSRSLSHSTAASSAGNCGRQELSFLAARGSAWSCRALTRDWLGRVGADRGQRRRRRRYGGIHPPGLTMADPL